jgi:hypothetical protein
MTADAARLEAAIAALDGQEAALRRAVFDRFFAAFPQHRARFLTPDATERRMTDETLQLLLGLAQGESWVWPQVADLVDLHRAYGALDAAEYDRFIDLVVEEAVARAGGDAEAEAAWLRQAAALKALVARAAAEWLTALPR